MATIIKQVSVSTSRHANNLRDYINDKDALIRDGQNITNDEKWFDVMDKTRDKIPQIHGFKSHNEASRKGAKNTTMYHQILAFLPEETDLYDGKMTPEKCIEFAKEYAQTRYPDQQIVFALHKEHSNVDNTDRYAVHMAINRTNLATGRRLHEGKSHHAKVARARSVREIDSKWDLEQIKEGVPNSKIHKRQPSKAEREMIARGIEPYKTDLRELVSMARDRSTSFEEFQTMLHSWGVNVEKQHGRVYARDTDNPTYKFNIVKLDADYTAGKLNKAFAINVGKKDIVAHANRIKEDKFHDNKVDQAAGKYKSKLEESYKKYVQVAREAKGTPFVSFPKFKPPRIPEILKDHMDSKSLMLSYRVRGDNLRDEYCGKKPVAQKENPLHSGGTSSGGATQDQTQQRDKGIQR